MQGTLNGHEGEDKRKHERTGGKQEGGIQNPSYYIIVEAKLAQTAQGLVFFLETKAIQQD